MDVHSWLLVAVLILLVLSMVGRSGAGEPARLGAIDRKLNLVLANLGIDPSEGLDGQIREIMRTGQKIEAIKLYRSQTGVGLKEAKDHVEAL